MLKKDWHTIKLRMKNLCNARNIRMGMLDIHVNVRVGIESITRRRMRRHKVRRNGTWVVKRWLRQGWNRQCSCIGCMGFRCVGRVLSLYMSGASTFGFEVSGTVETCKGWRRRTKGIGMISIWHHCKSMSQGVWPARRADEWHRSVRWHWQAVKSKFIKKLCKLYIRFCYYHNFAGKILITYLVNLDPHSPSILLPWLPNLRLYLVRLELGQVTS